MYRASQITNTGAIPITSSLAKLYIFTFLLRPLFQSFYQPPFPLFPFLTAQNLDRFSIPDITETAPQGRARDKITPALKDASQIPSCDQSLGQDGQQHGVPDEQQLQEGVDLADFRGADLRARQAEVPVAGKGLGGR